MSTLAMTPCGLVDGYICFGGTYRLHLQDRSERGDTLFRNVGINVRVQGITCNKIASHVYITYFMYVFTYLYIYLLICSLFNFAFSVTDTI
jgi:type IV secretory pathway VirB3-like protein